jgi:hypothetical protein
MSEMFIPNTPTPSGLNVDPEYVASLENRLSAAEEKLKRAREGLKKIARSAPCKEGHMSFNTPEQECDQRIAEEVLREIEGK